jgi:hypothetical protein
MLSAMQFLSSEDMHIHLNTSSQCSTSLELTALKSACLSVKNLRRLRLGRAEPSARVCRAVSENAAGCSGLSLSTVLFEGDTEGL